MVHAIDSFLGFLIDIRFVNYIRLNTNTQYEYTVNIYEVNYCTV